jgi:hypothetical protein
MNYELLRLSKGPNNVHSYRTIYHYLKNRKELIIFHCYVKYVLYDLCVQQLISIYKAFQSIFHLFRMIC